MKFSSKILFEKVKRLFIKSQESPEQIANRFKHENYFEEVSYNTIYRAMYQGLFDNEKLSKSHRKCIRLLRPRGKSRHNKTCGERRDKIRITNSIHERSQVINNRSRMVIW